MSRKGNFWMSFPKYNLRKNYHHYNLRSRPIPFRRYSKKSYVRRHRPHPESRNDNVSEVAILNMDTTFRSISEYENPDDDSSEDTSESLSPRTLMSYSGFSSRLRYPFSISQPLIERYSSPRASVDIDNFASGDGHFNNVFTFQIGNMDEVEGENDNVENDNDED